MKEKKKAKKKEALMLVLKKDEGKNSKPNHEISSEKR